MFKWACLIIFLLFVYHVREVFPPFIMGGIIAYLLNPLVRYLCRNLKWLKPGIAIAIIYIGTIVVLSSLFGYFGKTLLTEAQTLYDQRHQMTRDFVSQISDQFHMGLDAEQVTTNILESAEHSAGRPEEIAHVGGIISKSLLAILVTMVSSIYFMLDSSRVGKFFLRFVPHDKKVTVVNLSSQMNVMLSKYVSGQLILIFLMSVVAFCFLSAFGIKYALLIAIISGVLEIIPVLGPFCAITLATGVAVAQLGFTYVTLGIPLCFFIARQIEDYIVVPRVIGHAVELHPLAVIFAVLVGETMAGALGMLVAIPVAASVKLILDFVYPPDPEDLHRHEKHGGPIAWLVSLFHRKPQESHATTKQVIHSPQVDIQADTAASGLKKDVGASLSLQSAIKGDEGDSIKLQSMTLDEEQLMTGKKAAVKESASEKVAEKAAEKVPESAADKSD